MCYIRIICQTKPHQEERVGQPEQEKRQVWEELSKNIPRAQIRETSSTQRGTRQERHHQEGHHRYHYQEGHHQEGLREAPSLCSTCCTPSII